MRIKRPGVYQIVNEVNGKFYVGSSIDVTNRWGQWRSYAKNNNLRYPSLLVKAFIKYGIENFTFILLEQCEPTKESLEALEQHYIDLLKPQYNILPKAYSAAGRTYTDEQKAKMRGRKHTSDAKDKISKARKGCKLSAEHVEALKNRVFTEQTRANMAKAKLGTTASDDTRKKMSKSHKGLERSTEHVANNIQSRNKNRLEKLRQLKSSDDRRTNYALRRLSTQDVQHIRTSDLMDSIICKQYNCTASAIRRIRIRQTYKDVA